MCLWVVGNQGLRLAACLKSTLLRVKIRPDAAGARARPRYFFLTCNFYKFQDWQLQVLVLGGRPGDAPQREPAAARRPPPAHFNHYSDGHGAWVRCWVSTEVVFS